MQRNRSGSQLSNIIWKKSTEMHKALSSRYRSFWSVCVKPPLTPGPLQLFSKLWLISWSLHLQSNKNPIDPAALPAVSSPDLTLAVCFYLLSKCYSILPLYAGQEATVRTGHGTTNWFQIRKGVHQGCILSPLSPCLIHF